MAKLSIITVPAFLFASGVAWSQPAPMSADEHRQHQVSAQAQPSGHKEMCCCDEKMMHEMMMKMMEKHSGSAHQAPTEKPSEHKH
jgi:hypothetical protein